MSQTIALDAIGPSRWTHMAVVMADALERMAGAGKTEANEVPAAALFAAKRFFAFVEEVFDGVPENPTVSIANYTIAANAVQASAKTSLTNLAEVDSRIQEYSRLVSSLERPRVLSEKEVRSLEALRDFFLRVAAEGSIEEYNRSMRESTDEHPRPLRTS